MTKSEFGVLEMYMSRQCKGIVIEEPWKLTGKKVHVNNVNVFQTLHPLHCMLFSKVWSPSLNTTSEKHQPTKTKQKSPWKNCMPESVWSEWGKTTGRYRGPVHGQWVDSVAKNRYCSITDLFTTRYLKQLHHPKQTWKPKIGGLGRCFSFSLQGGISSSMFVFGCVLDAIDSYALPANPACMEMEYFQKR